MNQVCCSDERMDYIFLLVFILIPNIYGKKREKTETMRWGKYSQ